jgi:hypothetical protein
MTKDLHSKHGNTSNRKPKGVKLSRLTERKRTRRNKRPRNARRKCPSKNILNRMNPLWFKDGGLVEGAADVDEGKPSATIATSLSEWSDIGDVPKRLSSFWECVSQIGLAKTQATQGPVYSIPSLVLRLLVWNIPTQASSIKWMRQPQLFVMSSKLSIRSSMPTPRTRCMTKSLKRVVLAASCRRWPASDRRNRCGRPWSSTVRDQTC